MCCSNSNDLKNEYRRKAENSIKENSTRSYESITSSFLKYDEKTNTYYYKVECISKIGGVYYEINYYVAVNSDSVIVETLRNN